MKYLLMLLAVIMLPLTAFAEPTEIRITELVITSKIVKGKPLDSIKRLSSSTDKNLYCFSRTLMADGTEAKINHLWFRGDEKVAEYTLPVKGEKWRTYSRKQIQRGSAGEWRVDVTDESGKVLKSVKFRMN